MEFYVAQMISVLVGLITVIMMQFKSVQKILVGQIIVNLLTTSTCFLLGRVFYL